MHNNNRIGPTYEEKEITTLRVSDKKEKGAKMNPEIVTNNFSKLSIRDEIQKIIPRSKKVTIAVAFFNDAEFIKQILNTGAVVTLIVSLRPPTCFYALKEILHREKLNTFYLGQEFHSKIYEFLDDEDTPISAIIGSSNLTFGGLGNNIETNVILQDVNSLKQVDDFLVL